MRKLNKPILESRYSEGGDLLCKPLFIKVNVGGRFSERSSVNKKRILVDKIKRKEKKNGKDQNVRNFILSEERV